VLLEIFDFEPPPNYISAEALTLKIVLYDYKIDEIMWN